MPDFSADLAVVIGVDDYTDAVGRLQTPVQDARAVAGLLASRFGYEVILRCDAEATLEKLRTLLQEELPRRVPEGSRLFFYFAGHGVALDTSELEGPRGSLVPHGGTAGVETHLSMDELYAALTGLPCRHLLVVLDCCFGGSFRWAGRRPLFAPGDLLYEERYRHWVRHPAHWFLSSAAHDQYALDTLDRRRGQTGSHSPFAAAVLDGLAGKADLLPAGGDGVVTMAELYAYVQDRLSPHQSPVLSPLPGHTKGEYVFRSPGRTLPSAQSVAVTRETNPYRGLKSYRAEHAGLFFGRGAAARSLLRHVRGHGLTVVVGPSGSGKSSLVQAGLLPRLRLRTGRGTRPAAGWRVLPPLRVTADPFTDLHTALAAAGGPPPPEAAELRRDAGSMNAWVAAWRAAHPRQRLLLVVDQAEELVTRVPRSGAEAAGSLPAAAAELLERLGALLGAGEGRLRVLLAVRSDYEPDVEDGPLAGLWSAGRFIVPPLTREDLREVVEGPAAQRALYFDDPRLVERLVDEVVGMPGGLPLLSYALSQLYFAYVDAGRGDRLLTAADLAAIGGDATASEGPVAAGGIVRILRKAADGVVQALPDGLHRETLWRVLLRMVNLVGVRPTRRRVPSWELVYPEPAENRRRKAVLAELIGEKARLLVSGPDPEAGKAIRVAEAEEEPDAIIEPAHDELLVAWPELARRIEAARVLLPIHRRLGDAAAEWWAGGCRTRDLDLRLLGLVETGDLPEEWLNKVEDRYVTAAREERRWRTLRRWTAAVVAFLAISGAALFFYDQSQRNARLSYQSRIQGLVNQAGADLDAGRTARGLLLARQAFGFLDRSRGHWASRMGLSLPWISSRDEVDLEARIDQVFRRVLDDLPPSFVVLRDPWSSEPVAFHPGGRLLVTVHRSTPVLVPLPEKGVKPEGPVQPLAGVPAGAALQTIAFSSDGHFLAVGFFGGALCVWRLDGTPPAPVPGTPVCAAGRGAVTGLAFRPGTSTLVAGRDDGTGAGSLQVWEVAGGQGRPPRLTRGFERPLPEGVQSLAVSPSGDLFLSLKRTAGVLRGTLNAQAALAPMDAPADQEVESLTLDDSGRLLAGLVTPEGEILGWELPEGRPFLLSRQGTADAMALAQAGDHLVTVDIDERLSRIGGELPAEPEEVRIPSLCDSGPVEVAVPRGGQRIAVFCDGALRLWEPGPMEGEASRGIGRTQVSVFGMPTAFAALPGSATPLAIADANGDVELHDLKTGETLHIPRPSSTGMLGLDLTLSPELGSSFGGSGITGIAWGPGGTVLHVLAQEGLWWTYDVLTRTVGTRRLGGRVCAAAGSADGVWLAVLFDPLSSAPILALYKSDGAPVSLPPPPSARGASSLSGAGLPVFPISRYTVTGRCKAGLAFHPDRTELAVGIGNEVSLYDVPAEGRWQSRRIAETRGMIFAAAWKGDLLAIGGGVAGATSDGFVELLGMDGEVRYTWTVPGAAVSGLAVEPGGERLAASTNGGGVYVWKDGASGPSAILGKSGDFTEFPLFLEPGRVAALTSGGASVWSLGTRELADTFCATAASNLESRDWVNYVDADLGRYEPACPALPFHPSLLGQADFLAAAGRGEEAQRLYRWINELEAGSVVNPARRARGQALAAELSGFDAMDRQGVLAGLRRAEEHEELRRAEDLLPLPKDALIRLCRRSVLFGEARRALPFCEDGVKLHGDVGAARDSRGLALAVLGQSDRAREDFIASRDWLEEPAWRERRQAWIGALSAGRNPITPQVLRDIAREELKVQPSTPPALPNQRSQSWRPSIGASVLCEGFPCDMSK